MFHITLASLPDFKFTVSQESLELAIDNGSASNPDIQIEYAE